MATARTLSQEKKKIADLEIITDPEAVAEEAGLRYVSDDKPGYTRKKRGKKFVYFDTEGKEIRDETRILRINRLAIPPAYTDVWICPSPNGHLQATGRDDRGRKQYRYHERWREERDENKYEKMVIFAQALPKIRRRINKDLKLRGLPREKVLATVVQLLERTFIRIGNEEYAKENKSFGLTTMRNRHVEVKGATVRFRFRGKSGKDRAPRAGMKKKPSEKGAGADRGLCLCRRHPERRAHQPPWLRRLALPPALRLRRLFRGIVRGKGKRLLDPDPAGQNKEVRTPLPRRLAHP